MNPSADMHKTGVYHHRTELTWGQDGPFGESYRDRLRWETRTRLQRHLAEALSDGREYVVRVWEVQEDVPGLQRHFTMHATVLLRNADAALIGDAVPIEALPIVNRGHRPETGDGRRFKLEDGGVAGLRYWRRIL